MLIEAMCRSRTSLSDREAGSALGSSIKLLAINVLAQQTKYPNTWGMNFSRQLKFRAYIGINELVPFLIIDYLEQERDVVNFPSTEMRISVFLFIFI